ncbi:MAG TPA: VOC family protein [Anaerolineae bacterium]|nr:VOC family protein [Anaerolineae bacterium]
MITQFAGASIWSENLNNLLPFYRDVLGLKVTRESPGFVLLGEDRPDVPALGPGTHREVHGRNTDPARHMVGFASDDLTAEQNWWNSSQTRRDRTYAVGAAVALPPPHLPQYNCGSNMQLRKS